MTYTPQPDIFPEDLDESLIPADVLEIRKLKAILAKPEDQEIDPNAINENLQIFQDFETDRIKDRKLEVIRMAFDIIRENNRSKPLLDRDITAEDLIEKAKTLDNFVDP